MVSRPRMFELSANPSQTGADCALQTNRHGRAPLRAVDLGLLSYNDALAEQRRCWNNVADNGGGYVLFNEHPAVITLGKRDKGEGVLVPAATLEARGIEVVNIERGGLATLHSPGQLVVYFIVPLRDWKLSVKCFVHALEKAMAETCVHFGVTAAKPGSTNDKPVGAWVENRKIGQIGIAVRRGITFHGLAFNVANDLSLFSLINPCGLGAVALTSLQRELGETAPTMATVKNQLKIQLATALNTEIS